MSVLEQPLLSISVSKKDSLIFFDKHLEYRSQQLPYEDFEGYSYLYTRTSRSINFIPIGTTHSYYIGFTIYGQIHKINFSSKGSYDAFAKITLAFDSVIKKFVLLNLLIKYGEQGGLVLGGLTINSQGMFKKRLFGTDNLSWGDYWNSEIKEGSVIVYRNQNEKPKLFFSSPLSNMNAPLLPDILNFLLTMKGVLDSTVLAELRNTKQAMKQSLTQKQNTNVCAQCGSKVKRNQKFCGACGNKLNV